MKPSNKYSRFYHSLVSDYGFRTVTFSVVALVFNVGFAIFNGVMGIMWHSVWYGALAAYYILLGSIRGSVLLGARRAVRQPELALRRKLILYRNCGVLLLVLELALTVAVAQMVISDRPPVGSSIIAIATAAYTFYRIIFAVYNTVKARRLHDPMLQAVRNIGLTDAAVSVVSLQVTMCATFSDGSDYMLPLHAVSGFTVCALTVVLGIVMIVGVSKRLKDVDKFCPPTQCVQSEQLNREKNETQGSRKGS